MPRPVPPYRPQISREFLEEHRRRRYVAASAELLHEFGRAGPTVTNIVRLAGTARNSFYEVFGGGEDCIAYGIGLAAEELFAGAGAQEGEGAWLSEVHAAISGFYRAVAADPILAELYLIHAAASRVDRGRAAAEVGVERLAPLFARGREEGPAKGRRPPAPLTEECMALGIISLAARRVRTPEVEALPQESIAMARLVGARFLAVGEAEDLLPDAGSTSSRA